MQSSASKVGLSELLRSQRWKSCSSSEWLCQRLGRWRGSSARLSESWPARQRHVPRLGARRQASATGSGWKPGPHRVSDIPRNSPFPFEHPVYVVCELSCAITFNEKCGAPLPGPHDQEGVPPTKGVPAEVVGWRNGSADVSRIPRHSRP